jgi:NAD(P) transhydrogenase subunit alpha
MIIGVPGETASDESRVALVPDVATELVDSGHEVHVAAGAGESGDWTDEEYEAAGCTVVADRAEVFDRADVILQVRALGATESAAIDEYREGQIVIGLLGPYEIDDETLDALAERDVSAFALELIPRISRAQSMDALSSMASLGGYKAALVAAEELPKMFPLEMTAAGTIQPAEVFVIGAGVAGLKAIATAERLGASVRAYDIRLEVKREVESLGADFVELDLETEGSGDDEGYATEMGEEFYEQQRKELTRVVADSDVVITTAAIPGQPAPELVTTEMIENMDAGSVIIDLSAATGGNCEPTVAGNRVEHQGVTILGPTDLPSTVTHTASEQLANNMRNFLDTLLEDGTVEIDLSDEIIDSTLLTHNGAIRTPHRDDESEDETAEDDTDGEEATDAA